MFETLHHMPVSTCGQLRSASNAELAMEAMGTIIPTADTGHNTTRFSKMVSRYGPPRTRNSRKFLT
jgi:hypothetical protein